MKEYVELTETEIRLGFAASCVERLAQRLGCTYAEAFARIKRAHLLEEYIIPCYDALHTQSWEYVTDALIDALTIRESRK